MKLTIDASVFVAAARPSEPHYAESRSFIIEAQLKQADIICPTILLAECSAAIARRTGNPALGQHLVASIEYWKGIKFIPVSLSRARQAAKIAADHKLRGADAIYVSVAEEYTTSLIAWDNQMLQSKIPSVEIRTPIEWLRANPPNLVSD